MAWVTMKDCLGNELLIQKRVYESVYAGNSCYTLVTPTIEPKKVEEPIKEDKVDYGEDDKTIKTNNTRKTTKKTEL